MEQTKPTPDAERRELICRIAYAAAAVTAGSVLSPVALAARGVSPSMPLQTAQLTGNPAPAWDIVEWFKSAGNTVEGLRGKVIVIDFFQLWCPGCNQFSGPLMNYWQQKYATAIADDRMRLVKIHTVFEGHSYQSRARLVRYIKEKAITIPVGVDRHRSGDPIPVTMRRYRTRGTPEIVVIDPAGIIQFQKIGFFQHERVEALIDKLLLPKKA